MKELRWLLAALGLLLLVSTGLPAQPAYEDLVSRAGTLLREKKNQEALALIEQAIQLDEKRWEAYVLAASAYSAQQLFDDAIGMLQSALTRAPQERKQLIRDALAECRRQIAAKAAPERDVTKDASAARAALPPPAGATVSQPEIVLWKTIEKSTHVEDFQAYLDAYPNGLYVPVAQARIAKIREQAQSEMPGLQAAEAFRRLQSATAQQVIYGRRRDHHLTDSPETFGGCMMTVRGHRTIDKSRDYYPADNNLRVRIVLADLDENQIGAKHVTADNKDNIGYWGVSMVTRNRVKTIVRSVSGTHWESSFWTLSGSRDKRAEIDSALSEVVVFGLPSEELAERAAEDFRTIVRSCAAR